jgi:hypothetical protein
MLTANVDPRNQEPKGNAMTEQNLTPDDTEGHGFKREDENDTEGHGFKREDEDDTEGHGFKRDEDEDDTEGHARRV